MTPDTARPQDHADPPVLAATVECPVDAVLDVVAWWRGANEAPGGCSTRDAINGMSKAVFALADAARKAGHAT